MVRTEDFAKRLEKIMEEYDLSAASFAQQIDVGRATISHIISGRNKPSLDVVMKIIDAFPEVGLYWLLNGKGTFPKTETATTVTSRNINVESKVDEVPEPVEDHSPLPPSLPSMNANTKDIVKILVLYTDGSFDAFEN